jgi:phytoene synthase
VSKKLTKDIKKNRKSENFPAASLLLPKIARRALIGFYNFARNADDISDNPDISVSERKKTLNKILQNLESRSPEKLPDWAQNFYKDAASGNINIRHGVALLNAFIQDTEKKRYETFEELLDYCKLSANPVGKAFLEATEEFSADYEKADKICTILQLLNHLQDAKDDYKNLDRVYFPRKLLISLSNLEKDEESPEFTEAKQKILDKIEDIYREAEDFPATIKSLRVRVELNTIINVIERLIQKLRNNDILKRRVSLNIFDKLYCFINAILPSLLIEKKLDFVPYRIAKKAKSSFFYPLLKLPKERRKAMFSLYAFCRLVDDAVDGTNDKQLAKEKLSFWKEELEKIYDDSPEIYPLHPISRSLVKYVKKYDLKKEYFDEIIKGQEMDYKNIMIRPSNKEFEKYIYRVASCVGLLSVNIFGYTQKNKEDIEHFAIHLGKAMQIVNIMRDVKEDAGKGRIYIPEEVLEDAEMLGIKPKVLNENFLYYKKNIQRALISLSRNAKFYFSKALFFLPKDEHKNMLPAILMMEIYQAYFNKMQKKDFMFNRENIKLNFFEKLKILKEI